MRTVRRLFYADIVSAVAFVALAFLALFFFIDFVDELGNIGQRGYTALHAAAYSLLLAPGHLYELLPMAVLIGAIYALARLAQTSQYTILRTGGLGPGRALGLLAGLALVFGAITFVVGDYLAPISENFASQLRAAFRGSLKLERSGAWIKEHADTAGRRAQLLDQRRLGRCRLDPAPGAHLRVRRRRPAALAHQRGRAPRCIPTAAGRSRTSRSRAGATPGVDSTARQERLASLDWQSTLSPKVVAAAVLPVTTMSTVELWRYIGHLAENEQAAQLQKIQFWKRALYPFACLVMVALALPFAYLSARSGGVSLKVFIGIMLGVSFVLLNNVFRHLGLLGNWTPWIVAAAPGALYLMVSLAAFVWLVRYR